jgi:ADP-ribosyl-[dinitrogen reductase] hydrolase
LMRLAPIPLFYSSSYAHALDYAALGSRTTHASPECIASCRYLTHAILRALSGTPDKAALLPAPEDIPMPATMAHIADQRFREKATADVSGSGYVVDSLEAALWAFWHTDDYRGAILAAANLGDDADTTAAICGQLAGAYYGIEAIPSDWVESLCQATRIRSIARSLVQHR